MLDADTAESIASHLHQQRGEVQNLARCHREDIVSKILHGRFALQRITDCFLEIGSGQGSSGPEVVPKSKSSPKVGPKTA